MSTSSGLNRIVHCDKTLHFQHQPQDSCLLLGASSCDRGHDERAASPLYHYHRLACVQEPCVYLKIVDSQPVVIQGKDSRIKRNRVIGAVMTPEPQRMRGILQP